MINVSLCITGKTLMLLDLNIKYLACSSNLFMIGVPISSQNDGVKLVTLLQRGV